MKDVILQVTEFELIKIVGGVSVIVTGLSVFLSSLLFERLKSKWQRAMTLEVEDIKRRTNIDIEGIRKVVNLDLENVKKQANIELEYLRKTSNKDIEDLKGEIAKNNSVITTLLVQQGQSYQKLLDKKIDATQKIWSGILQLKATMPSTVALVYDIFVDGEISKGILDEDKGQGALGDEILKIDTNDILNKQIPIIEEIRKLRPFVSAKISLLAFVYSAIIGRLIFMVTDTYKKGKPKEWKDDSGVKQLLETVLEPVEIDYIYNKIKAGHYLTTMDLLETKMLNEINLMLSGDALVDDAIAQVDKFSKILQNNRTKFD